MIIATSLLLLATQPIDKCRNPKTDQDVTICEYLRKIESFEIKTVKIVAFGTTDQMFSLKKPARECGTMNRVDPLDEKRAVLDIVNASEQTKKCLQGWIQANKPELEFTAEKRKELFGRVQ